jgi:hypothetical protein
MDRLRVGQSGLWFRWVVGDDGFFIGIGWGWLLGDDDRLGVQELAHAGGGELAAIAGALDAAEGKLRIAGDHGVDEDAAALELRNEALLLLWVHGPDRGSEAEGCVVGELDGLIEIADLEEHGDGSEDLLVEDGGVARDVDQHRGFEEVAATVEAGASGEDDGTGPRRLRGS